MIGGLIGVISDMFGIGIIGCGLIGKKRANSLGDKGNLIACADINIENAKKLAKDFNAIATDSWEEILKIETIDIVIVSTLHDSLSNITKSAIQHGKHVLVEKPAGRSYEEIEEVLPELSKSGIKVRVGFNHRYHPAILKAKEIIESGDLGELMFLRARYGHGGRLGYEKEWRADPNKSGGGEIIDQGSHLIDLSRMFLGDFKNIKGLAHTFFWDMEVEDNGFMILQNEKNQVAFLHASCTEWKNMFSFEIYGVNGKIDINGLGGSYGKETIIHYKMLKEMGPPLSYKWDFPGDDISWKNEMEEFYKDIKYDRMPSPGLNDANKVLKIINKIYKESGYDYSKKPFKN